MEFPLGQRLSELPGPLLLTGHTGFKGTWMTFLLEHLEVPVVGYSLEPEKDSLFDRATRTGAIPEIFADIRDSKALESFIDLHKPSTIIHMAAQPLVLKSYESPRETFEVNVMGTANLLDIAFRKAFVKAIVVVTTDKVYRNDNSGHAFVEKDPLGGKDPYSASKVGTEAVVAAWQQISRVSGGPKVVSVRAGNVIGGGDFAEDRIIPDLIRGALENKAVEIRNPESSRPWMHVLDPLSGYLSLLAILINGENIDTMNFGPSEKNLTVGEIADFAKNSLMVQFEVQGQTLSKMAFEANSLNLDSSFARESLKWGPIFSQTKAVELTFDWWKNVLRNNVHPKQAIERDIREFIKLCDSPQALN